MNPRQKFQFITAANITPAIVTFGSCFEAAFHSPISTTDNPSLTEIRLLNDCSDQQALLKSVFKIKARVFLWEGAERLFVKVDLVVVWVRLWVLLWVVQGPWKYLFWKWLNDWHCWIWHKKVKKFWCWQCNVSIWQNSGTEGDSQKLDLLRHLCLQTSPAELCLDGH